MNKQALAGNWMMFLGLFLIMIIITLGIVIGFIIAFGEDYEFKEVDSQILNSKLKKCISENPQLNFETELYSRCNLNQQVIEQEMFIQISNQQDIIFTAGRGDNTKCDLSKLNKNFPICSESKFNDLTILTGSNQKIKEKIV
jgi:hypothetical protein